MLLTAAVALGCLTIVPAAQAVPSISVVPEFPAQVKVGESHPASVLITATGDNLRPNGNPVQPIDRGGPNRYIAICNNPADVIDGIEPGRCDDTRIGPPYNAGILLTPSCASAPITTPNCDLLAADPGVFALSSTASGSGSCAGTTFDVTLFNAARGTVKFTPRGPAPATRVWLGQAGSSCRISFTMTVQKLPAPGTDGAVTHSIASAAGAYNNADQPHVKPQPLRAFGLGQTTVRSIPRVCPPGNSKSGIPLPANVVTPAQIAEYCNVPRVCPPGFPKSGTPLPANVITPADIKKFCDKPDTESDAMTAEMIANPRCVRSSRKRRIAKSKLPRRAANRPFHVTVNVSGDKPNYLDNVVKVEFTRNGKRVATVKKPSNALGAYRLRVNTPKLAPRHRYRPGPGKRIAWREYEIKSRVFIKAPGTFNAVGKPVRLEDTPGPSIAFAAVRVCSVRPTG